jgi:signal transduction histidine kinase
MFIICIFLLFLHEGATHSAKNACPATSCERKTVYNAYSSAINLQPILIDPGTQAVKKNYILTGIYLLIVLFMANLNAVVDYVQHPDIPYFDEEHLIVGGTTGLLTAILFAAVFIYTNRLQNQIAARRKAEDELQRINAELDHRVKERTQALEKSHRQLLHSEKLSAVGQLSASIAHEFNNPLQGIMNVLSGVHDRVQADEEDAMLLELALKECHRIKDLIVQLQSFNRPTTGRISFIDLHELIDAMLLLTREDFRMKGIAIKKEYAENMPHIQGVDDLLKQVILNLLTNAADACEGGGTISISTTVLDKKIAFRIQDSGKGISAKDLPHIFEPFFSTKPQVKGVGLGLSVSYGIIKSHNGRIEVNSQEGKGAVFTVTLPVAGLTSEKFLNLTETI